MTTKRRDVNRADRFCWYPEDMRFIKWHGHDVDPNDEEAQKSIRFWNLLEAYWERFGEHSITIVCTDRDWLAEEMRKALETGVPVPKPDLPPGAVI